jgi:hypothetical protein
MAERAKLESLKLNNAGFAKLRQSRRAVEIVAGKLKRIQAAAQESAPEGVEVDYNVGPGHRRAGGVVMAHNVDPGDAGFLSAALDAGRS